MLSPLRFANARGIDVIVTDHHIEPAVLPDGFCDYQPQISSSAYPFDGLCGAGRAWKVGARSAQKVSPRELCRGQGKVVPRLGGIGTLSDMVPLVGENRMLASFGYCHAARRRPGLAALLKLLRIQPRTDEDDIGFYGLSAHQRRVAHGQPEAAARLLATDNEDEAKELGYALKQNK